MCYARNYSSIVTSPLIYSYTRVAICFAIMGIISSTHIASYQCEYQSVATNVNPLQHLMITCTAAGSI